jgi:hypothetical protein
LILTGTTRVVVLAGSFAIKIARFKLWFVCKRGWQILFRGQYARQSAVWRENCGGTAGLVLSSLFAGIVANRYEYLLAGEAANYDLVRTHFTLGYLINIQERGEAAYAADTSGHPVMRAKLHHPGLAVDLRNEQFCTARGKLLLADYGSAAIGRMINPQGRMAPRNAPAPLRASPG